MANAPKLLNDDGTASMATALMISQGFAWASHGVAPKVLEQVGAMPPESLTSRLAVARAAVDARCERVWGRRAPGFAHATPER
jgi:hypothetical protein